MRSELPGTEDSATEMAEENLYKDKKNATARQTEAEREENLKINVFIADEKYAILIPRNEHQSDEEEIIRRSAKRVNDAIRELESVQKGITRVNSLAMVALQLAVNLSKLSAAHQSRENDIEKALRGLEGELGEEVKRINEYIEKE